MALAPAMAPAPRASSIHFVGLDENHDAENRKDDAQMDLCRTMSGTASMRASRARKSHLGHLPFPAHYGVELNEDDETEKAIGNLFLAYDLDESGEISRDDFLKIEMRMCFAKGEMFKPEVGALTSFSLMDRDKSGTLDFLEFRERQLSWYQSACMSKGEIIVHLNDLIKNVLLERVKMGPRYHAGIRQAVRRIFHLYDTSGDGSLEPSEWIAAQKLVALEIMDDIDEAWVDEASFTSMDTNGDGFLDMEEYMDASFAMFEVVKLRSDALCQILQRVVQSLEKIKQVRQRQTFPLTIFVQSSETPQFRPPHSAWQDEPTDSSFVPSDFNWRESGTVQLPLSLHTVEEVSSILRLLLQLPVDTWLSVFCAGVESKSTSYTPQSNGRRVSTNYRGALSPACLLRGERAGHGNIQSILEWLAKPNAVHRLYVKNLRKRPQKLIRQSVTFFEERESLLARQTGQILGLDWETQLVGQGRELPNEICLNVGDGLMLEVPQTDDSGEFRFVSSIYMDGTVNLSRPLQTNVSVQNKNAPRMTRTTMQTVTAAKEKKRTSAPRTSPPAKVERQRDVLEQLTFVALKPGRCVMFVDVSWEDQEEKLAAKYKTCAPVNENSIGRIGPIQVVLEPATKTNQGRRPRQPSDGNDSPRSPGGKKNRDPFGAVEASNIMWWNGEKWSNKKGAAPKKKGKK
jgi:Ca2+-binding EF-hand superfamily protein